MNSLQGMSTKAWRGPSENAERSFLIPYGKAAAACGHILSVGAVSRDLCVFRPVWGAFGDQARMQMCARSHGKLEN